MSGQVLVRRLASDRWEWQFLVRDGPADPARRPEYRVLGRGEADTMADARRAGEEFGARHGSG